MANLHLDTQSNNDPQANDDSPYLDAESTSSETPEDIMPPPYRWHLPEFEPKILYTTYQNASAKDRETLKTLYDTSGRLSTQLQGSTTFDLKVQELYKAAGNCTNQEGSEDLWIFSFVGPILRLALELSKLDHAVQILPLETTAISPGSLLPQWRGEKRSRKIDFGLVAKLDDDTISHKIINLPDLGNGEDNNGIGPTSEVECLRNHPLFCHIEVKKQHQVVDPIVQLGVWTSAVYTRWEQVKKLHNSSRDLPISFGWTIEGRYWCLYLIRRSPDGSQQITEGPRAYDTSFLPDIYRIIVTLHWLMNYGQGRFREEFLESVLGILA